MDKFTYHEIARWGLVVNVLVLGISLFMPDSISDWLHRMLILSGIAVLVVLWRCPEENPFQRNAKRRLRDWAICFLVLMVPLTVFLGMPMAR